MKVVLLNTAERTGGAAVAANRLQAALQKAGLTVCMLVRDKQTEAGDVVSVNTSFIKRQLNRFRFVWERLVIFVCNRLNRKNLFQVSLANTGNNLDRNIVLQEADIIHLHWINQGFLSLKDIERLLQMDKPIVWTLHDLWPATGICHYPGTCERYHSGCSHCPLLVNQPLWDLAKQVFDRKKELKNASITFVGCSTWISSMAKQSGLLQQARFMSIPNPIDTTVFRPIAKKDCREQFNLPLDKALLLFAAAKLSDTRKGAVFLIEACRLLAERNYTLEVVLMGSHSDELIAALPFPVHELGYISDQETMAKAYASVDLFVIPSLEDNLPNTIMEAMACGTPSVGFETGGIPEMIDHKNNGYVARYKEAEDLADGIQWILENKESKNLSRACLEKVQTSYRESVVAEKYIHLYKNLWEKKI
ncbi:glycosyltransferase [Parabacteroides sp. 52]|uniref:glycosyltransferase family 4 protein n=1 Tax=unclassified Parabacteroides TaxID=2649774 RepID=UPI0013D1C784|nr:MULTISPECIES: glycosyltransferase family 4 protein [unclassified Parabacteroides]MDH6534237.1 glycosyltransferase involved in cell wall biosynthesis [Parabacteroides sp. PM5-20]NDV55379.1 glycosyltransferase [Parabacteroides sp. 52]